jgi:hypothetical protein
MNKVKDEVHMSSCRCDLCEALRKGEDITKKEEPSQQEQVREWIEEQKAKDAAGRVYGMPASESTLDYTADSLVSKQSNRIQELVNAHWSYMEKVLSTGQDKQQTFTWDQMMEIRKWDYTSSAIHFYGHGYEDAANNQDKMEKQNGSE